MNPIDVKRATRIAIAPSVNNAGLYSYRFARAFLQVGNGKCLPVDRGEITLKFSVQILVSVSMGLILLDVLEEYSQRFIDVSWLILINGNEHRQR
ncbi:hypothetical protein [Spirosoma linguale]|uniref:hypothetical protein n=1 Tax=Spirosoma linguale TaxID=108 RepID=UPI003CC80806